MTKAAQAEGDALYWPISQTVSGKVAIRQMLQTPICAWVVGRKVAAGVAIRYGSVSMDALLNVSWPSRIKGALGFERGAVTVQEALVGVTMGMP